MAKKSIGILELTDEEFWEGMGSYFVQLTENLGFFNLLQHLGRELRDFFPKNGSILQLLTILHCT